LSYVHVIFGNRRRRGAFSFSSRRHWPIAHFVRDRFVFGSIYKQPVCSAISLADEWNALSVRANRYRRHERGFRPDFTPPIKLTSICDRRRRFVSQKQNVIIIDGRAKFHIYRKRPGRLFKNCLRGHTRYLYTRTARRTGNSDTRRRAVADWRVFIVKR